MASIMGSHTKEGEVGPDLVHNPLASNLFIEDSYKMGHSNPAFVAQSDPSVKIFVDPSPEILILLDLMVGLCEGTTTSATKSTEGKTFLLGKGQIAGSHQQIGIAMDRFDGITAAAEIRDIGEMKVEPFGHLPRRDLVVQSSDRNGTPQKEGIV
jgi:hypothetical protein